MAASHDGLRTANRPGTFEWWYFDGITPEGLAFQIHFQTPCSLYPDPRPSGMIHLVNADGLRWSESVFVDPRTYTADADACNVVLGPNAVSGNAESGYQLKLATDSITANLTFHSEVPIESCSNETSLDDADESAPVLGWLCALPSCAVSGSMIVGDVEMPVEGMGYHDHNWGQGDIGTLLTEWYWGRVRLGRYTIVFVKMFLAEGPATQFVVFDNGRLISDTGTGTVTPEDLQPDAFGTPQPQKIQLDWSDGSRTVSAVLTNPKHLQVTHEFSRLSASARDAADALTKSPSYNSFVVDASLTATADGTTETASGKAIFEHRTFS